MLNKAVLMGRLTRDPELRYTQSNVPVTTFTLAVDRDIAKEGSQDTDFINIVAWRGNAEFVAKWFRKGQLVTVVGRIQVRSWKNQNGEKRTVTEIVADECYFAEAKREERPHSSAALTPSAQGESFEAAYEEFEALSGMDPDLPF